MAKISLLSPEANQPCNETILPTTKFSKNRLSSDAVDIVRYNNLSDLEKYGYDGRIGFDVQILVNPTKYFMTSVMNQMHTKFLYTAENVSKSGRKCSPEVTLSGVPWYIALQKNETEGDEASLKVFVHSEIDKRNENWKWSAKISIKLLSFDESIPPITRQLTKNFFYRDSSCWGYTHFVDWKTLMDPTNKYVKDDTVIFEIDLEVQPPKPLIDFKSNWLQPDMLECSVCLQTIISRDPVVTKCGHLFCEACIKRSIEDIKQCSNCKADADSEELRKVYL